MSKTDRYPAKWEFKLDCGHAVAVGQKYVVTKIFTCEKHTQQSIHGILTNIQELLENGITTLKRVEWDLRHSEERK